MGGWEEGRNININISIFYVNYFIPVFRNGRCEEKANIAYEEKCRSKAEAFYAEAERKFDSEGSDNFESDDIDLKGNKGKILLNRDRLIEEFKQELESKLRENMPPPRQVSSVLKVRVNEYDTSAILTIWTPNEDIVDIFKEGTTISIRNIFASGKRYEFYTLRKKKKERKILFPSIIFT